VVGVNQAGQDDHVARVDDLIGGRRQVIHSAKLVNHVIDDVDAAVAPVGVSVIHGDDQACMLDEQGWHRSLLLASGTLLLRNNRGIQGWDTSAAWSPTAPQRGVSPCSSWVTGRAAHDSAPSSSSRP